MSIIPEKLPRKWYYAAGAVFAALLIFWALMPAAEPVEIGTVRKGLYEQFVKEEGITRVREKYSILSPVNGVLQRVKLHAGDPVRKGQVLAYVKWDDLRAVRSPGPGKVLRVVRESEGPIQRGQPIMEVGDVASLEIVIDALTADAVKIRPDAPLYIQRWGGPTPLTGKIQRIEPSAFTKVSALGVDEQRVRIIADITSPPESWSTLGDRFRVECRIVVHREQDAIIAPAGALVRDDDGWAVFRVEGGRAKLRPVRVAMRGPSEALVREGLNENDELVVYPGDRVKDGGRVREL